MNRTLLFLSAFLLWPGQFVFLGAAAGQPGEGKSPDLEAVVERIVGRTNEFRKGEELSPVKVDPALKKAAEYFAGYMARTGEYGHEADGKRPRERAEKHGYEYCLVSENIAYQFDERGFTTDQLAGGLFLGWKDSPPHRKNMLDPDVTETGVAVARSEKSGRYYAVQMFGRPKSAEIVFKVANRTEDEIAYTVGDREYELEPGYTRTHRRCRPGEMTFPWPGEQEKTKVTVKGGEDFTVTRNEEGTFTLKQA